MSPREVSSAAASHGDVLTAISDGMVALLKEFYGRGPTRTKSYYADDLVPFIPGARDLPRRIPIYKPIWRDHYRAQQAGGT